MVHDLFGFLKQQPIVHHKAPQPIKTFAAHAMHQATRWSLGDIGLQEAVDGLRETAWRHGLVRYFQDKETGTREVEWIIGYAFAEYGVDYSDIRPHEV